MPEQSPVFCRHFGGYFIMVYIIAVAPGTAGGFAAIVTVLRIIEDSA